VLGMKDQKRLKLASELNLAVGSYKTKFDNKIRWFHKVRLHRQDQKNMSHLLVKLRNSEEQDWDSLGSSIP